MAVHFASNTALDSQDENLAVCWPGEGFGIPIGNRTGVPVGLFA